MGKRVSNCLRREQECNRSGTRGQLGPCETARGNHVVRVTLLPITLLTPQYNGTIMPMQERFFQQRGPKEVPKVGVIDIVRANL